MARFEGEYSALMRAFTDELGEAHKTLDSRAARR